MMREAEKEGENTFSFHVGTPWRDMQVWKQCTSIHNQKLLFCLIQSLITGKKEKCFFGCEHICVSELRGNA